MLSLLSFVSFCIIACLIGLQIYIPDLLLLTNKYNYRIGIPQSFTYISLVICILVSFVVENGFFLYSLGYAFVFVIIWAFSEYKYAKFRITNIYITIIFRVLLCSLFAITIYSFTKKSFIPFFCMGVYIRNFKYGITHPNLFVIAKCFKKGKNEILIDSNNLSLINHSIPDFSYAGNHSDVSESTVIVNVRDFGIASNTNEDLTVKVQNLIDKFGQQGGAHIFFPRGRYIFNTQGKGDFLQINYSNITLEGELDNDGQPLAKLINCGNLVRGNRNPWLSPFFITTGEQLQESNMFWGLQFRKKKDIVMRSGSMSDPGSDGTILTPRYATFVTKTTLKGSDIIYVDDSSKINGKYILLGMYNTNGRDDLLKDILGLDHLHPEWVAANRAGEEEAPSYQWLVEIKEIVDQHIVRLTQPHRRDCDMKWAPAVFNVEMLENIFIKNLHIASTWNGQFHHHGQRGYYSISQAQEMDYGWNGINFKRVAHGNIENVILDNFTNPLYVLDSRNITCEKLIIKGHDGHQGIKVYEHSCDNLFRDVQFFNHYADMMGGEGNMYGNVFSRIYYLNPVFKPVDFDFHGFSEGPMSPPMFNLFENIYNFAYIHYSGSIHMHPAFGRCNYWWNCKSEGELKGDFIYKSPFYYKLGILNYASAIVKSLFSFFKNRSISKTRYKYFSLIENKKKRLLSTHDQCKYFRDHGIYGLLSSFDKAMINKDLINIDGWDAFNSPLSLYQNQLDNRNAISKS